MNGLLDVQGLTPFFPQITRSTLGWVRYAISVIYFRLSNSITNVITSLISNEVINWTHLRWNEPEPFLRSRSLQIGVFGPLKGFWTPCQHRRRQIQIQEPILVVHLYPAGQYSINKIPSDNHKWRHESTNFWMWPQRSECKKPNAVLMVKFG